MVQTETAAAAAIAGVVPLAPRFHSAAAAAIGGLVPLPPRCAGKNFIEDNMSILPRHTKVIVIGNNRTKTVLVGHHGIVVKAVGLGGWHWLVLCNGMEVKLQRNALMVLQPPTGLERDEDLIGVNMLCFGSGSRKRRPYRARQPSNKSVGASLKTKSVGASPKTKSVGAFPKTVIRSLPSASWAKPTTSPTTSPIKVDLSKLDLPALWKYLRHFNLMNEITNPSKEHLIDIVEQHFMAQQLDELKVFEGFAQAAKKQKTDDCN